MISVLLMGLLMLAFFGCTDEITGPGIIDTTATQTTETTDPGDMDTTNPGAAAELTEGQVREATVMLLDCYDSSDVQHDAEVPGSGVTYDPDDSIITFTDYDISGYSFNTSGWQSISGTIQIVGRGSLLFDISLKGSDVYSVQFAIDLYSMFNTVSVTVNGKDYMVQLPDESEGIPDNCDILHDTTTAATINTPRWPSPYDDQRVLLPSDHVYSTASEEDALASNSGTGIFSYGETVCNFEVESGADVNSTGGGNAELSAYSMADARGINFPSATTDMAYQVFGDAYHYVYFSASSDNPETTRISVSFNVTASGSLSYEIGTDTYEEAFTSLSSTARLSRMGWYDNHEGGIYWRQVALIDGVAYGEVSGYAVIGDVEGYYGGDEGIFDGDVPTSEASGASVSGSLELTGEILPDDEMFCLSLSLFARSIVEFTGGYTGDEGYGKAVCENAEMSYTYSAEDPDHPDANITLNFYIPDF